MTSGSGAVEFNLQNTLQCHTGPVNHLAVSQEYSHLISIGAVSSSSSQFHAFADKWLGDDSRVVVWSVASGEKLFVAERPFNGPATAVSWASRNTSCFVIGFASGDLYLFWSENGGKVMDSVLLGSDLNLQWILVVPRYYWRIGREGTRWGYSLRLRSGPDRIHMRKIHSTLED
jgi:hypothetical protein